MSPKNPLNIFSDHELERLKQYGLLSLRKEFLLRFQFANEGYVDFNGNRLLKNDVIQIFDLLEDNLEHYILIKENKEISLFLQSGRFIHLVPLLEQIQSLSSQFREEINITIKSNVLFEIYNQTLRDEDFGKVHDYILTLNQEEQEDLLFNAQNTLERLLTSELSVINSKDDIRLEIPSIGHDVIQFNAYNRLIKLGLVFGSTVRLLIDRSDKISDKGDYKPSELFGEKKSIEDLEVIYDSFLILDDHYDDPYFQQEIDPIQRVIYYEKNKKRKKLIAIGFVSTLVLVAILLARLIISSTTTENNDGSLHSVANISTSQYSNYEVFKSSYNIPPQPLILSDTIYNDSDKRIVSVESDYIPMHREDLYDLLLLVETDTFKNAMIHYEITVKAHRTDLPAVSHSFRGWFNDNGEMYTAVPIGEANRYKTDVYPDEITEFKIKRKTVRGLTSNIMIDTLSIKDMTYNTIFRDTINNYTSHATIFNGKYFSFIALTTNLVNFLDKRINVNKSYLLDNKVGYVGKDFSRPTDGGFAVFKCNYAYTDGTIPCTLSGNNFYCSILVDYSKNQAIGMQCWVAPDPNDNGYIERVFIAGNER